MRKEILWSGSHLSSPAKRKTKESIHGPQTTLLSASKPIKKEPRSTLHPRLNSATHTANSSATRWVLILRTTSQGRLQKAQQEIRWRRSNFSSQDRATTRTGTLTSKKISRFNWRDRKSGAWEPNLVWGPLCLDSLLTTSIAVTLRRKQKLTKRTTRWTLESSTTKSDCKKT